MLVVVVDIPTHRVVDVIPTGVVVEIVDVVVSQKITTMLMGQIQKQITFYTFC